MRLLIRTSLTLPLVFATAPAVAGERYDRKLEQAAEKIGDIRGSFSYGQKPQFIVVQDTPSPGAGPSSGQGATPSIVAPPSRPAS
jgi:hypothetical protein